jgi:hypothetical protein
LKSEEDFRNLYVEGGHRVEVWDAERKELVLSNSSEVEGWLLNEREGRYRFNVANEMSPWIDGPQPHANDKYEKAFNGRVTQTLTRRTGNMEEDQPFGEITSTRHPLGVIGSFPTGWGMSIYGLYSAQNKTLSELFDAPNRECTLGKATFEGRDCITLTSFGKYDGNKTLVTEAIHLDPARGYALTGYEYSVNGKPVKKIIVEELVEPAPGIFYPSKAKRINYDPNANISSLVSYAARKIVVNSPTFTNDIFTINWPTGITVYDHTADVSFAVGPDEDESRKMIDELINQVEDLRSQEGRATLLDEPTQRSGSLSPADRDSGRAALADRVSNDDDLPPGSGDASPNVSFRGVLLLIGALCACLGTCIWLARKKKTKCISMFIACCLPAIAHSQMYSVGVQELQNQKVYNCGLLSTMYILGRSRVDYTVESLATALEVGDKWENPTSLLHIKNLLLDYGFSVAPYKGAKGEDIVENLTRTKVCLVSINKDGVGHFVIVEARNENEVVSVEPGVGVRVFSNREFTERIDLVTTGFCLFVDRDPDTGSRSLKQDVIRVDIGELGMGQGELVISVPLMNDTEEDFRVLRVKGECSCFLGYTMQESKNGVIAKGRRDRVFFKLSRAALPPGEFKSKVLCVAANPTERHLIFLIQGKTLGAIEKKVTFYPEKVRLGPDISQKARVAVFLPPDVELKGCKTSSENIGVRIVRTIDNVNNSSRKLIEFEIGLNDSIEVSNAPQFVEVNISDRLMPCIRIPCLVDMK